MKKATVAITTIMTPREPREKKQNNADRKQRGEIFSCYRRLKMQESAEKQTDEKCVKVFWRAEQSKTINQPKQTAKAHRHPQ
jgi:hypothetical protein